MQAVWEVRRVSASNDEKIGCGAWIIIAIVVIFFLGQLGASTVGVGK